MKIRWLSVHNFMAMAFCIVFATAHTACNGEVQPFSITILEAGGYSGIVGQEMRLLVISQPAAFEEIYGEIVSVRLPRRATPEVDFSKYRVIIALMGERPSAGYGIAFAESARQTGDTIEIQVLRTAPEEDAIVAQVISSPYVMATIARDHYAEIVFVDETESVLANVPIED